LVANIPRAPAGSRVIRTQPIPSSSASSSPSPSSSSSLGLLKETRVIDRVRYQAKLVFDNFDKDQDGRLSLSDLQSYFSYCHDRLGPVQALQDLYANLVKTVTSRPEGRQSAGFEEFVDLVRAQLAAVRANKNWVMSQLPTRELSRLLQKSCLTMPEMAGVLATFRLLDVDNDGRLPLAELEAKAQGIEKQIVDGVLADTDPDNDGLLTFEDFLTSYHKERPTFQIMAVMAANCLAFWLIFQAPVDMTIKAALALVLVIKPQIINTPIIKVWTIIKALIDGFRARQEVGGGGWKGVFGGSSA